MSVPAPASTTSTIAQNTRVARRGPGAVARATDGHTLLFSNTGHAVNRALYARLDYDPATDLVPITIVAESPMVLLVPNSAPWRDVAGLVAARLKSVRTLEVKEVTNETFTESCPQGL